MTTATATMTIIKTERYNYPGAWDNWNLPEFYTVATVLNGDEIQCRTMPDDTKPNATPEDLAHYECLVRGDEEYRERLEAERQYKIPTKGKLVRVFKGRKVPIGTEGRVFWYGENQWGFSCGIELQDGKRVFTAAGNVEVTGMAC